MLVLALDMFVMWFLLNIFSERHWDDEKLKVFMITLLIVLIGSAIITFLTPYLGFFSLGAYVVIGGVILKSICELSWQKAFQAMGIFLSYRIVLALVLIFLIS